MRDRLHHIVPAAALAVGCIMLYGMREEQRVAGMDQFLNRNFQRDSTDPGYSVYVGYYTYQVQGKAIHSPKNCLPGAGWEPLESAPRTVDMGGGQSVTVNRYLLANKGAQ